MNKRLITNIIAACVLMSVVRSCGDNFYDPAYGNDLEPLVDVAANDGQDDDIQGDENQTDDVTNDVTTVVYDNWSDAYEAFLTEKTELIEWIQTGSTYSEMCFEPSFVSGFSIGDLDGDEIPELLVLAQPGWDTDVDERIRIYSFDESLGQVVFVTDVISCGYKQGYFSSTYSYISDTVDFLVNTADKYNGIAGVDTDGMLVVFGRNYDEMDYFSISKVDIHKVGGNRFDRIYEAIISGEDVSETGDKSEAERILEDIKPVMFYELDEENITTCIDEAAAGNGFADFPTDEVTDYLRRKYAMYSYLSRTGLDIDGYVANDIAYNYEFLMQWYVESEVYFDEIVSFETGSNEYTELVEVDKTAISLIVDLDNDGISEAIVCEIEQSGPVTDLAGFDEDIIQIDRNQTYYKIRNAYFINEDKSIEVMDIPSGECLMQKQCLVRQKDVLYLALNGYYGTMPYGQIITVICDEKTNLTWREGPVGHKYFTEKNLFVWYKSFYGSWVGYVAGESYLDAIKDDRGQGLCVVPYYYYVDEYYIEKLGTYVATIDEVEELAEFDYSRYEDCSSVQFIMTDNGILYVNCARETTYYGVELTFDKYVTDKGKWTIISIYQQGYYEVLPTEDNDWDCLNKVHQ